MCPGPEKSLNVQGEEGAVAQLVKCLLGKQGDQSLESQCPSQKAGTGVCICDPAAEGRWVGAGLDISEPN